MPKRGVARRRVPLVRRCVHGPKKTGRNPFERLGGHAQFIFLPGRSRFDVYKTGEDRYALFDRIATEMYSVARPNLHAH
jgi:hypothetical protein